MMLFLTVITEFSSIRTFHALHEQLNKLDRFYKIKSIKLTAKSFNLMRTNTLTGLIKSVY